MPLHTPGVAYCTVGEHRQGLRLALHLGLWPPTVGCSVGIYDLQGEILGVTLVLQTCLSLMYWTNTVVGSGNTTETLTKVCVPGELADMPGSERSLGHWGQGSETNDHGTLQRSQGQSLS